MRIFISNIPYETSPADFETFLEREIGKPTSYFCWPTDKLTQLFRGFCFVEFGDHTENALAMLAGVEYEGRKLCVAEAHPDPARLRG